MKDEVKAKLAAASGAELRLARPLPPTPNITCSSKELIT